MSRPSVDLMDKKVAVSMSLKLRTVSCLHELRAPGMTASEVISRLIEAEYERRKISSKVS